MTGAGDGVKGNIEAGFGKPTCSYLGRFGTENEPTCMNIATKLVTQPHTEGDPFPICDDHFEEFKDDYPMVVVQEL